MICTACGKDNKAGARFCITCGTPLAAAPVAANPNPGTGAVTAGGSAPAAASYAGRSEAAELVTGRPVRKKLNNALWMKGCPVVILRGAIADQPGSDEIDLTLEFLNLSDKSVEAIYFDMTGRDSLKNVKCDMKDTAILDLDLKPGNSVVTPSPIKLPDKTIRSFAFVPRHVVFTDETIWDYDGKEELDVIDTEKKPIPSDYAKDIDSLSREVTAHKHAGIRYPYYPKDLNDYWICACGQINTGIKCLGCDEDKELIMEQITAENLDRRSKIRLQKEEEERELARQRREEEERQRQEQYRLMQEQAERERQMREAERLARAEERRNKVNGFFSGIGGIFTGTDNGAAPQQNAQPQIASASATGHKFCKYCGSKMLADDVFCGSCGKKM